MPARSKVRIGPHSSELRRSAGSRGDPSLGRRPLHQRIVRPKRQHGVADSTLSALRRPSLRSLGSAKREHGVHDRTPPNRKVAAAISYGRKESKTHLKRGALRSSTLVDLQRQSWHRSDLLRVLQILLIDRGFQFGRRYLAHVSVHGAQVPAQIRRPHSLGLKLRRSGILEPGRNFAHA